MLLGLEACCGASLGAGWVWIGLALALALALALDPLVLVAWPRSCAYGVAGCVRGLTTTCYGAARCVRGLRG
jgi:hypothetical protein